MVTFREFESRRDLEDQAAALLARAFGERSDTPLGVMLAGGRTPLAVYTRIVQRRPPAGATLHLLISDERHVPEQSAEHNFAKIRPLGAALGLPAGRLLRVDTRRNLDEAAERYDAALKEFLQRGRIRFVETTVGDNAEKKPGFGDMIGRAKWDAWNGFKGTSADDAKRQYVALIQSLS